MIFSRVRGLMAALAFVSLLVSCGSDGIKTGNADEVGAVHNKIRGVTSYRREFNDLNDAHLRSARRIGISPIESAEEADVAGKRLLFVGDNNYYEVDELTHSIPFLVPRASAVLMGIAMNFQDSLAAKGLDRHRILVTSVLRTKESVRRLRRCNSNASSNSAHFHGTTFDISYNRFMRPDEMDGGTEVRDEKLKLVLAEVLRDMRKAGLCHVKYEVKQGCFHIIAK